MITPRATGGGFAAPTWGRFMTKVYYGDSLPPPGQPVPPAASPSPATLDPDSAPTPSDSLAPAEPVSVALQPGASLRLPDPWPIPPGLTTRQVDLRTGRLWSEWCRGEEYTEYYVPGTEPTEICDDTGRGRFRLPRVGRGTSLPVPSGQRQ